MSVVFHGTTVDMVDLRVERMADGTKIDRPVGLMEMNPAVDNRMATAFAGNIEGRSRAGEKGRLRPGWATIRVL